MPVTYTIDVARRVIQTACTSPLRFEDVVNHFRELARDPACAGLLDVLLDVSDGDLVPEGSQLQAISMEVGAIRDKVQFGICAIVATRDAMFGMMRMFEALTRPYFQTTRVFRDLAEAKAWLAAQQAAANPEQ